jgi:hypothetical protein
VDNVAISLPIILQDALPAMGIAYSSLNLCDYSRSRLRCQPHSVRISICPPSQFSDLQEFWQCMTAFCEGVRCVVFCASYWAWPPSHWRTRLAHCRNSLSSMWK